MGATDFAWAGPGRSTDQRNKFRMVHDECRVNGVTIHTGDFVLLGECLSEFFYGHLKKNQRFLFGCFLIIIEEETKPN